MSNFRDSFTKEDTKDDLLGYDDTACLYFIITFLTCGAVPWTCAFVYSVLFSNARSEKRFPHSSVSGAMFRYCQTSDMKDVLDAARKKRNKERTGTKVGAIKLAFEAALLAAVWFANFSAVQHIRMSDRKDINMFDPFDILGVTAGQSNIDIKRAYRRLSLVFHPDKNPDNPLAASTFIQISKAYAALTDDVAKRNWEKFGNPDGPQSTKIGIGLPRFLLEKNNSLVILCLSFFVIIVVVPVAFICYYNQARHFATNGVLIETLQFLGSYVTESTSLHHGLEMLAACSECRLIPVRETDNNDIKLLSGNVVEHKRCSWTLPVVVKNQYLIWAHLQRCHNLMSRDLQTDLNSILSHTMRVTQAMIEIACMRDWFSSAESLIHFRRLLVQAIDIDSSELLQVPHLSKEMIEHFAQNSILTLVDFVTATPSTRRNMLENMNPNQLADVEAFCAHISLLDIQAAFCVEDETEIIVGDVATVTVRLQRGGLQRGEATGPAHAPFFPRIKFEELWLFLVDEDGEKKRIIHFERILDTSHVVEEQLRFQVTKPGRNVLVLHALSDAYAGLDQRVEISFEVLREDEHTRPVEMHEADIAPDSSRTSWFQQLVGNRAGSIESDDDDEDDSERQRSEGTSNDTVEDCSMMMRRTSERSGG